MSGVAKITESEIFDALVTASTAPEDARTMVELQQATKISVKRLRRALQIIATEGRLTVYRRPTPDLSGQIQQVPVYTIAPKKRAKK